MTAPAEGAAALLSLLLMGIVCIRLLYGLRRLLRGEARALPRVSGRLPLAGMAKSAALMLLTRLALFCLAYLLYRALGEGEDSFAESFAGLWRHWDVRHYEGIARDWYVPDGDERLRLVFFPLYPWLMRLLMPAFGGDALLAGTAVSLACACCASALLYALAFGLRDARTARLSVLYFTLNPMSVFLCCCYTEALFLCLTLAALLLLARGRPLPAALAGMASAATRMPGVIVSGLFFIALLEKAGAGRARLRDAFACLLRMLLVFAGLFLYWEINRRVTGDPFAYLVYQRENWFQRPGTFWQSAANTAHYLLTTRGDSDWLWTWGFQLLAMGYGLWMLARHGGKLPYALEAYSFVYLAVVFSPTWLLSGARYLYGLAALPLLQAGAHEGRAAHGPRLALSGALLCLFTYGYCIAVEVL